MNISKYDKIVSKQPVSYKETQTGVMLYDKYGEHVGNAESVDVAVNIIADSRNKKAE